MSLLSILVIVVVLALLFGAFPRTGAYNAGWGFGPFGGILGLVIVVVIVLALTGHLSSL